LGFVGLWPVIGDNLRGLRYNFVAQRLVLHVSQGCSDFGPKRFGFAQKTKQ
jgi:hypothetical protein